MALRVKIGSATFALVATRDVLVRPDDLRSARRWAHALRASDSAGFTALAERLLFVPGGATHDDIVELVAVALWQGHLRLVRDEAPVRRLDALQIRDLVDPAARSLLDPQTPRRAPPQPADSTWVSFEVVDDEGNRFDAQFRCQVGSQMRDGRLQGTHRYEPIPQGSSARLELQARSGGVPTLASPAGVVPTSNAPPAADTWVSFEVVDDEGEAWRGRGALHGHDDAPQVLAGTRRLSLATTDTARLSVQLDEVGTW